MANETNLVAKVSKGTGLNYLLITYLGCLKKMHIRKDILLSRISEQILRNT